MKCNSCVYIKTDIHSLFPLYCITQYQCVNMYRSWCIQLYYNRGNVLIELANITVFWPGDRFNIYQFIQGFNKFRGVREGVLKGRILPISAPVPALTPVYVAEPPPARESLNLSYCQTQPKFTIYSDQPGKSPLNLIWTHVTWNHQLQT
jgi:hypothetical protein